MLFIYDEREGKAAEIVKGCLDFWATIKDRPHAHGTGVVWLKGERVRWMKSMLPADSFYAGNSKVRDAEDSNFVMGHVRRALQFGAEVTLNKANAHPFVTCDKRWLVMHNGSIKRGRIALEAFLREQGHVIKTGNDSELIAHAVEEVGILHLHELLYDCQVDGMINILAFDKAEQKVWAFSDGGLVWKRYGDGVIVASNYYPFKEAEWDSFERLESYEILELDLGDCNKIRVHEGRSFRYIARPSNQDDGGAQQKLEDYCDAMGISIKTYLGGVSDERE